MTGTAPSRSLKDWVFSTKIREKVTLLKFRPRWVRYTKRKKGVGGSAECVRFRSPVLYIYGSSF